MFVFVLSFLPAVRVKVYGLAVDGVVSIVVGPDFNIYIISIGDIIGISIDCSGNTNAILSRRLAGFDF